MDQYNQNYTPDYGAQVYDQAPPPPQRNTNRTIMIVVGVLLLLCCCCLVGFLLLYFVFGDIITDQLGITQLLIPLLLSI